jgi:hypothetical protein
MKFSRAGDRHRNALGVLVENRCRKSRQIIKEFGIKVEKASP